MNTFRLPIAVLISALLGCALAGQGGTPDPQARLALGLSALAEHDAVTAREHFEAVYREHGDEPVGTQALLALIAGELDPHNPTRSLSTTAELATELLHAPDAPPWSRTLGHTLYLVALELGAKEEAIARAETAALDANGLPELTGLSYPAQLQDAHDQRERLQRQVDSLTQQVGQVKKELEEKEAELERIRKTVKG